MGIVKNSSLLVVSVIDVKNFKEKKSRGQAYTFDKKDVKCVGLTPQWGFYLINWRGESSLEVLLPTDLPH